MAVFQVGTPKGMVKDVNPTALPNEFFSHTENARFEDNAAKKILGHDIVFTNPSVAPYKSYRCIKLLVLCRDSKNI